ncbi:MAG: glycosyltransferase family 87 protein [Edaphobacter sp.]
MIRTSVPGVLASGSADFRALYSAGYIVRTSHAVSLYDYDFQQRSQNEIVGYRPAALPFVYPAYTALLFVPLSLLLYKTAYFAFLALNLGLVLAASFIIRPHLSALTRLWPPLPTTLFLSFFPVGIALIQGQLSLVLLLLYCASFAAFERTQPFLAGVFLALALVKFQIALPIAFLFAAWRCWRFVAGVAVGAIALALVSLSVVGGKGIELYLHSMISIAGSVSAKAAQAKYGMFPANMPNLHGLFYVLSNGAQWGSILLLASSVLLLMWAMFQRPSFSLALIVGLLVSYHLQPHDLSLLLLPTCLILNEAYPFQFSSERVAFRYRGPSSSHSWRSLGLFGVAVLWVTPLLQMLVIVAGWHFLFVLAMLPFLLPWKPGWVQVFSGQRAIERLEVSPPG